MAIGYTPKRMEEIFLNGPVVDDFLCGKAFLEKMYRTHGKTKMKAFTDRQSFDKSPEMEHLLFVMLTDI